MADILSIFDSLRETLFEYSELVDAVEIKIFSIQMRLIPGTEVSGDPALLSEFTHYVKSTMSLREVYSGIAEFLTVELQNLRHEKSIHPIISAFENASKSGHFELPVLQRWNHDVEDS